MTDPRSYPADEAIVRLLLDAVTRNSMLVVTAEEERLAAPSFDPPRAHVEVTERFADGSLRKRLVELGELDIDGEHVFVRRGGELYKTLRNLDTTVDRNEPEYRSKHLFAIAAREVVRIERSGSFAVGEETADTTLVARRDGIEWRLEEPWSVAGDGKVLDVYLFQLAALRLERYASEGQHAPEVFGLDEPELRVELTSRSGAEQVVRFGRKVEGGAWFAQREGLPHVWEVSEDTVWLAATPASAMLRLELWPLLRSAVEVIDVMDGGRALRVARDGEGWSVAETVDGDWTVPLAADRDAVERILSTLETAKVSRYLPDAAPEEILSGPRRSLAVTQQGQAMRVHVGGRYRSEEGSEALRALRDGDELVALVPTELEQLFALGRRDLQSLAILELDEVRLTRLELEAGGVTRTFRRAPEGVWKYLDMDAEATELHPVLDPLFFLRAESHRDQPAAQLPPLAEPIEVRVLGRGATHAVTIGLAPDGTAMVDHLGTRSVLAHGHLHAKLAEILAKKSAGEAETGSGG